MCVQDETGLSWQLKHVSYSRSRSITPFIQQPPGGHHWKQLLYLEGLSKVLILFPCWSWQNKTSFCYDLTRSNKVDLWNLTTVWIIFGNEIMILSENCLYWQSNCRQRSLVSSDFLISIVNFSLTVFFSYSFNLYTSPILTLYCFIPYHNQH